MCTSAYQKLEFDCDNLVINMNGTDQLSKLHNRSEHKITIA